MEKTDAIDGKVDEASSREGSVCGYDSLHHLLSANLKPHLFQVIHFLIYLIHSFNISGLGCLSILEWLKDSHQDLLFRFARWIVLFITKQENNSANPVVHILPFIQVKRLSKTTGREIQTRVHKHLFVKFIQNIVSLLTLNTIYIKLAVNLLVWHGCYLKKNWMCNGVIRFIQRTSLSKIRLGCCCLVVVVVVVVMLLYSSVSRFPFGN